MSQTISPATDKSYGVERICQVWEQARSTFYARKQRLQTSDAARPIKKRGPKPAVSDEILLDLIRADLAASPFHGEGHRPVYRRLRYRQGVRAGRMRVLRIMREHNLLSPYRSRPKRSHAHDGTITTEAPNIMWGTDGAKIYTLNDGWVWAFIAVEHWNAECVGWHVTKTGNRLAALEPISQGLTNHYGSVARNIARGLKLRMDHGSQYTSDHFIRQIRYWGIADSFAFVSEPQTNGVAERFIRTLKEQAVYGHTFHTVEEVRRAVGSFIKQYNSLWMPEKNNGRSPREMRQDWLAAHELDAAA